MWTRRIGGARKSQRGLEEKEKATKQQGAQGWWGGWSAIKAGTWMDRNSTYGELEKSELGRPTKRGTHAGEAGGGQKRAKGGHTRKEKSEGAGQREATRAAQEKRTHPKECREGATPATKTKGPRGLPIRECRRINDATTPKRSEQGGSQRAAKGTVKRTCRNQRGAARAGARVARERALP